MRQHLVAMFVGAVCGAILAALLALMVPAGRVDYAFAGDNEGSTLLDYAGPIALAVGVVAGAAAGLLLGRRRSRRS